MDNGEPAMIGDIVDQHRRVVQHGMHLSGIESTEHHLLSLELEIGS